MCLMSNGWQVKTHEMQVMAELAEDYSESGGEQEPSRELGWDSNCL